MIRESGVDSKTVSFILCTVLLFAADQVSKQLVVSRILPGHSVPFLGGYVSLAPIRNTGLAMGFLPNFSHFTILITVLVLIVFILSWLTKFRKRGNLGITFIIAGAAGNLWDRVLRGAVVDFIDVTIWPIFNLADVLITVGVVLTVYSLIFSRKNVGHNRTI